MSRSNDKLSLPAIVVIGAVAVIAIIASGVLRGTPASGVEPRPADDFSDGEKTVKLDVADPNDVFVGVRDHTGRVVDATTGRAGDGMSVRWYDLKVENVDDDTLRLTWVGYPNTDPIKVAVFNDRGTPTIVLMSLLPPPNSDALGIDRVLDLHFASPVSPDDFAILVQDGMDTDD
jgi:hypothetical protein